MKTNSIISCALALIIFSILTWKSESVLYAILAYTTLIILLRALVKKALGKMEIN